MIYDYADQEGWVSIWVGNCAGYETLNAYLSTVYLEEWENRSEERRVGKECRL